MEVGHIQMSGGLPSSATKAPQQAAESSFSTFLLEAVKGVNQLQHDAEIAVQHYTVGKSQNLHDTMMAMEKADISLRLLMQVRNKAVEAYQEIMRMQL